MYQEVLKNDIRYMKKDPMVWMILSVPILYIAIYHLLVLRLDFLLPYKGAIQYMIIVLMPFFIGMVLGFRMLDEKDEHMLSFYAVSPLGIRGYIGLRVAMAVILNLLGIIMIGMFGVFPRAYWFFILIQTLLLAPFVFLILGLIGKNKIQGLTLVKIMGMIFMLPLLKLIKANPLDKIFILIPSYNIFELIVNQAFDYGVFVYIGALCLGIYILIESFSHKCISEI
ncbi:hypothetical protein [Cellulosilyticum sp. I15G10I2]|uniref:hypothetical protein n=1 Tax=Cellulosilyticum sp. I15G10I2 TaxID=1892843 RepID=UPI00085CD7C5|nr:hypothetical protein [Cellulosilyticum sp. I15G10I2]